MKNPIKFYKEVNKLLDNESIIGKNFQSEFNFLIYKTILDILREFESPKKVEATNKEDSEIELVQETVIRNINFRLPYTTKRIDLTYKYVVNDENKYTYMNHHFDTLHEMDKFVAKTTRE